MDIKKLFSGLGILLTTCLGIGVATSVISSIDTSRETDAAATIEKPVTRIFVDEQTDKGTKVISIENIAFADGYSHDDWRFFLRYSIAARSSYNTSNPSTYPSAKGWSYMSNSEQYKYLICPTGDIDFTFDFPEWVTYITYKVVTGGFSNWLGGTTIHTGWGYTKLLNNYVYDSSDPKISTVLSNVTQTTTWGDVKISRKIYNSTKTAFVVDDQIDMSKYYHLEQYDPAFGSEFDGWYSSQAMATKYTDLVRASTAFYGMITPIDAYLIGTMTSWSHDTTYDMTATIDYQYMINVTLEKDTEFKVYVDGVYYGYENVITTDNRMISEGYITYGTYDYGTRIKVGKTSTFEIYIKTHDGYALWIQQDHNAEANEFALMFLENITCNSDSVRFDINVWNNVAGTSSMEYQYSLLTKGAKDVFKEAIANEGGSEVEQAVARYDRILYKYGYGESSYHDFMERSPSTLSSGNIISLFKSESDSSNFVVIIIISSIISLSMITGLVLIKREKMY